MTLEKLKSLLEGGAITQEEYDEMIKHVDTPEPPPQPNPEPDPEPVPFDKTQVEQFIQSRVDTLLAAERKKSAQYKKQLETLQKQTLTDSELQKIELEEKEKDIAERERAIKEKENRLYAVKALKGAGLDDGSELSMGIVDFVMGEDETEINMKIKSFKDLFDKKVEAEVNKRFKENGYKPQKGSTLNGGNNPYLPEQFNLTKQMEIETTNPDLAAQLKAAAGVK